MKISTLASLVLAGIIGWTLGAALPERSHELISPINISSESCPPGYKVCLPDKKSILVCNEQGRFEKKVCDQCCKYGQHGYADCYIESDCAMPEETLSSRVPEPICREDETRCSTDLGAIEICERGVEWKVQISCAPYFCFDDMQGGAHCGRYVAPAPTSDAELTTHNLNINAKRDIGQPRKSPYQCNPKYEGQKGCADSKDLYECKEGYWWNTDCGNQHICITIGDTDASCVPAGLASSSNPKSGSGSEIPSLSDIFVSDNVQIQDGPPTYIPCSTPGRAECGQYYTQNDPNSPSAEFHVGVFMCSNNNLLVLSSECVTADLNCCIMGPAPGTAFCEGGGRLTASGQARSQSHLGIFVRITITISEI
ncbi:hypothetical protein B0J11DRAFT_592937 [Dendryphion nanum]|uniref:Uncharacterized protein n=1 Tax=Dendryphion nanum TaxID=256645 RepID=A0A9P9DD10_9PLEO|nr:hypothetical protein B0J11DRAFT_592937 [Dendryphion nanum]